MAIRYEPVAFDSIGGFVADDHLAAFTSFLRSARAIVRGAPATRPAKPPSPGLLAAAHAALESNIADGEKARQFFFARFCAFRVAPPERERGFLTGYYEPWVAGSPIQSKEFSWPILTRPADLVTFAPRDAPAGFEPGVTGARRTSDGRLAPYPDRTEIERSRNGPILWVRDAVEAFLIQVQGSARIEFPDGRRVRLAYDGRNGLPYTSIGRILIETGQIREEAMSLDALKSWLREAGLAEGQAGLELMRRNRSFVFFRAVTDFDAEDGPIAGADVALTPLRSIAIDRTIWAYGTPVWIEGMLPWRGAQLSQFGRLMIAQDTGSAIQGAARADIFFGGGPHAGIRAGAIRHPGDFTVLLPIGEQP